MFAKFVLKASCVSDIRVLLVDGIEEVFADTLQVTLSQLWEELLQSQVEPGVLVFTVLTLLHACVLSLLLVPTPL